METKKRKQEEVGKNNNKDNNKKVFSDKRALLAEKDPREMTFNEILLFYNDNAEEIIGADGNVYVTFP